MEKKTKQLFAATLALFLMTGILAGIVIERKILFPLYNQPAQETKDAAKPASIPGPPDGGPGAPQPEPVEFFLGKLIYELELNAEQIEKTRAILKNHEKDFVALRMEIKDRFDELDEELSKNIQSVLDDRQKNILTERFTKWRHPQPPPLQGGPPGPPGLGGPGAPGGFGGPPGPPEAPQAAFDACEDKEEGAPCSFEAPHGLVKGICGYGGRQDFVCKPVGP